MNHVHEQQPGRAREEVSLEELAAIDLNLLVAFDALARELSVTQAARRIGVTQSAVSHALRRLRGLLGDELFVRGQRGMMLTPRAEALVVPLRSGLVTLGRALKQPQEFEPASARRAFRIATPDLFDVLVIPHLLERIRKLAPGVDLSIVPVDQRNLEHRLETGEVDLAVVPRFDTDGPGQGPLTAAGLVRSAIFRDEFVCMLRTDHPALRGRSKKPTLTLESYAELSHLLVAPRGEGRGYIDEALAKHGLERRIALRVPHFYSAFVIVEKSDLVLTAPSGLARVDGATRAVRTLPPPLELPTHTVNLVWHERFSKDPGQRWLREQLTESGRISMGLVRS
ncbi:MAG TPA: LysR family transcriptional regulator [Polyangiales bacterium]|nr:LysR family transcriptional regulator [Polyangiales bacterium]